MINKKKLLERFIRYVKVDSLSKKEGKFASLIKKELRQLGIKCREDGAWRVIHGQSGNLFASLKANVKGVPRILLNAHLDTVPPGTNVRPRIVRGKVKSDGKTILGADNKAGVAVIMEILKLIKGNKLPHGDLDILFTVAEEIGLSGSKYVNRKFMKADFGYVLDGGDVDEIINEAPSQDSLDIRITGRAAHAGVHPKGINAIKVASEAVAGMRLGRLDFETTANVGVISGGIASNIVPEVVTMKAEARSHDPSKLKRQVAHMVRALSRACRKHGAKLKYELTPSYKAFEVRQSHKALVIAKAAARGIGIKPKIKATGGGSDANIFHSFGVPCVIIGVGADSVHTTSENIAIDDMVRGARFVLNIIRESINV